MKRQIPRRDFLQTGAAAAAAGLFLPGVVAQTSPGARVIGANDTINVAVIGCGWKGWDHVKLFSRMPNVRVVAVCDADQERVDRSLKTLSDKGQEAFGTRDMRKVFDMKDVDGVVIATPNHWHALATIWACQAGKDVYVEKPVTHCLWEGPKMAEAARKYKRIVQAGTQLRSDVGQQEAMKYIKEGHLGKITGARAFSHRFRLGIGQISGPQRVPASVDYNLYCGPRRVQPLMRPSFHYDWHWFWETGNGELGNLGVHRLDLLRAHLGLTEMPPRVLTIGGRFGVDDCAETPNTEIVLLGYEPAPIIVEIYNLPSTPGTKTMPAYRKLRDVVIVDCEDGYFAGYTGGWVYDKEGNRVKQFVGDGGATHAENWIACMRSRKPEDLVVEIDDGQKSSALAHLGQVSFRAGHAAPPAEIEKELASEPEFLALWERIKAHLAVNEIDLEKLPAVLGSWLTIDPKTERFTGGRNLDLANQLLRDEYREPFVVPENV